VNIIKRLETFKGPPANNNRPRKQGGGRERESPHQRRRKGGPTKCHALGEPWQTLEKTSKPKENNSTDRHWRKGSERQIQRHKALEAPNLSRRSGAAGLEGQNGKKREEKSVATRSKPRVKKKYPPPLASEACLFQEIKRRENQRIRRTPLLAW